MSDDVDRRSASTARGTTQSGQTGFADWQAGVVGGLVGAGVMGVLVTLMAPQVLRNVIPAMYTLSGGIAGWTVHLSHGAVIGVGFAALVRIGPFDGRSVPTLLVLGLVWGLLVWIGLAALLMPVWLLLVGAPNPPMVPNFALPSLLWHLVYGAVLGGTYGGVA